MRHRLVTGCGVILLMGLLGSSSGCREGEKRGAIMLAFNTDLSVPKDVKSVGLYITQSGNVLHFRDYPAVESTNPNEYLVHFPSTFAVVSGGQASGPVRVQIVAYRSAAPAQPFILKEAITTVPTDRTALLRMPLQYLDAGEERIKNGGVLATQGSGLRTLASPPTPTALLTSDCPDPATQGIVDGECGSIVIDSAGLPDYKAEDVFGGGSTPEDSNALCFDANACMSDAIPVGVNGNDCVSIEPSRDPNNLNVAIETRIVNGVDGFGLCEGTGVDRHCRVVLDRVEAGKPGGWYLRSDNRVVLPKAVCTKVQKGEVVGLFASAKCDSKRADLPVCGPWGLTSAKPKPVAQPDAGPPIGDGGPIGPPLDDGGMMMGIQDIGPGEKMPMGIAVLNARAYVVARNGHLYSFDKDKSDPGSNVQVVMPEDPPGQGREFGYSLAVSRTATSDAVVVRGSRTPNAGGLAASATFLPTGAPSWPVGVRMMQLGPAFESAAPPFRDQVYGVAKVGQYGFVFAGQSVDSTMAFQLWQSYRLKIGEIEIASQPVPLSLNDVDESYLHEGAVDGDANAAYFAVYSPTLSKTIVTQYQTAELDSTARFPTDTKRIGEFPRGHRVFALSARDPVYVYALAHDPQTLQDGIFRLKKDRSIPSAEEVVRLPPNALVRDPMQVLNGIVADENPNGHVYYTTSDAVWAVNKGSKVPMTISPTEVRPRAVTLDDDHVYWTYLGMPGQNGGTRRVKRLAPQ